jgi:hypothetical protein
MKKFLNENFTTSIIINPLKGIDGIAEIFSSGADAAYLSCDSENDFYLIDTEKVNTEITPEDGLTLENVLSSFKNMKFIIEIFGKIECSGKFSDLIKKYEMEDKVIIWSQNPHFMKKIRKILPSTATAMTPYEFLFMYFLYKTGFLYFKKQFKADCLISTESVSISFVLNEGLISELARKQIFSIALTDSSVKQIRRLFDSGCRGFVLKNTEDLKIVNRLFKSI